MSLTESLLLLGALVIAGVIAHGQWQARKLGARRGAPVAPPLEPAVRHEPGLQDPAGEDATPLDAPLDAEEAAALPPAEPRPLRRRALQRIDALVDAIVPLRLDAPVAGELVVSHLPPTRRAGTKPFLIEGLNAETGEWEPPQAGQRYGECQAAVLLANRSGALNEIEYSEFVQKIARFAEGIGATPEVPDMLEVVARARELDAFAGEHDAQLAVVLRARGAAWSVGYVQQQAAALGFIPGVVPGRLIRPAAEEGAPPILALTHDPQAAFAEDPNQATLRELTLAFDVPQTDPSADPFTAWREAAQALAAAIEADVVDDTGRPLPDAAFASIGGELGRLYEALQSRDLAAGSGPARRLFS